MMYDLINWVNGTSPAINATNLNKMDEAIGNNINPDINQQTLTSLIESTPTGAQDRGGVNAKIGGLTLVNGVVNGDFGDGTDGWTGISATLSVTNNELSFTPTAQYGRSEQSFVFLSGEKYFIYAKVEADNNNVELRAHFSTSIGNSIVHNGSGNYEELYDLITPTQNLTNLRVWDKSTSGWSEIKVDGNVGIFSIKVDDALMTDLGLITDSEIEAYYLSRARKGYIDGMQSAENVEVVSVGKNGFNVFGDFLKGTINAGVFVENGSYDVVKDNIHNGIKVQSGAVFGSFAQRIAIKDLPHTLSLHVKPISGEARIVYNELNFSGETLVQHNATNISTEQDVEINTGTLNSDTYYIEVVITSEDVGGDVEFTFIQSESSATATTYEAYKESSETYNTVARRVPTAEDTIDPVGDGRVAKTKRVEEYVLQSADFDSIASGTNLQRVRVPITTFSGISTLTSSEEGKTLPSRNTPETDQANFDTVGFDGYHSCDNSNMLLLFPLGTYASLAAAQADLEGTVVQYELATPTTEYIDVTGQLELFENGTIYVNGIPNSVELDYPINPAGQRDRNSSMIVENAKAIVDLDNSIGAYPSATINGSTVEFTTDSTKPRYLFTLSAEVTGTPVQFDLNGLGAVGLKQYKFDGTLIDVESISAGLREVYYDGVNFIYAPKGANPIEGWSNPTIVANQALTANAMTSRLSVSNADGGWINCVTTGLSVGYISIKVDGVFILGDASNGQYFSDSVELNNIRYDSSFEIYSSSPNYVNCFYSKGKRYNDCTYHYYTYDTGPGTPTLQLSVSGSGWISQMPFIGGSSDRKLVIDSVTLINNTRVASITLNARYENGFDYYANTAAYPISYIPDV